MKADVDNVILVTESVYHIFNKSIAGYTIFNNYSDFIRMRQVINYYQREKQECRFSRYISEGIQQNIPLDTEKLVDIICYCIMNTHIHLILKQIKDNGVSIFMSNILNSYTRYFNVKYKRKGPLWESRFKRMLVETDEQLLHLTRYIHLNPVTAYLTDKPEEWEFSSYKEYLSYSPTLKEKICDFSNILQISPHIYKKFVEDNIDYQRNLANIRHLMLDQDSTS